MAANFESLLEETVRSFYSALLAKPRAYYQIDSDNPVVQDELTVVFTDGSEVMLKCDGRGEYDYVVMARPKYPADSTKAQITNLARHKSVQPVALRYMLNDQRELIDGHTRNIPRIEVPYDFVKEVFDGKVGTLNNGVVSIPYKIIGGLMTLDTKVAEYNAASCGT